MTFSSGFLSKDKYHEGQADDLYSLISSTTDLNITANSSDSSNMALHSSSSSGSASALLRSQSGGQSSRSVSLREEHTDEDITHNNMEHEVQLNYKQHRGADAPLPQVENQEQILRLRKDSSGGKEANQADRNQAVQTHACPVRPQRNIKQTCITRKIFTDL